jgi:hypothetical protein
LASVPPLVERSTASHILDNSTVPMTPERMKKRELVRELKGRNEQLIAMAIESAMDCSLENQVLYLQYQRPSVNEFIFNDSQRNQF